MLGDSDELLTATHELAIAGSVVEIALRRAEGRHVRLVRLKLGAMRPVLPTAIEFAFELLAVGTLLEGAQLAIERVPASGRCAACNEEADVEGPPPRCARCGGRELTLLTGEELYVDGLELGDESARGQLPGFARRAGIEPGPGFAQSLIGV